MKYLIVSICFSCGFSLLAADDLYRGGDGYYYKPGDPRPRFSDGNCTNLFQRLAESAGSKTIGPTRYGEYNSSTRSTPILDATGRQIGHVNSRGHFVKED